MMLICLKLYFLCNFKAEKYMLIMKYFNYLLIVLGAIVAIYAKTGTAQNQYILIGGIVVLMVGIYRISKTIPSKNYDEDLNNNEN